MALVMIACPNTGREVSTGVSIPGSTWNSESKFYAITSCPLCRTDHEWCAEDVTLYYKRIASSELARA